MADTRSILSRALGRKQVKVVNTGGVVRLPVSSRRVVE